jgi:hypothetical protein
VKQPAPEIIADGPASWSGGAWVFGVIVAALWIGALVTDSEPGVMTAVAVMLAIIGGIGRGLMRRRARRQRAANA